MLKYFFCSFLLFYSLISKAQTKLPSFFGDNMVLQQNEEVSIWGWDDPNATITAAGSWGAEASARTDEQGKWKLKIPTPSAGGPYTLRIKGSKEVTLKNILIGEVWLCSGQSNMMMPLKGYKNQPVIGGHETALNSVNDQIRLFKTKKELSLSPLDDVSGEWKEATPLTASNFSAVAYYFGKKLQSILNVPVGLMLSGWGGSTAEAWMDEKALNGFDSLLVPTEIPEKMGHRKPTLPYNAMLHPFIGFDIKGFIWYQGESNHLRPKEYKSLFPTLIRSWREKWQQDSLPFYFVQIAPFQYRDESNAAFLREAQLHTMQTVTNTGMAVTLDIGECNGIHPREKKLVGDRLAYWALAKTYDVEGVAFSGPVYREMEEMEDGKVKLRFDFAPNGFSTFGRQLDGFEVAGEDQVFYSAQGKICQDKSVLVWCDEVENPVAVRYAFESCPEGTLFNTAGLPASSFRTNNWE